MNPDQELNQWDDEYQASLEPETDENYEVE